MRNLAESVAEEHWLTDHQGTHCVGCGCGWIPDRHHEDSRHVASRHVAETVELLVREQIGAAIAGLDGDAARVARDPADLTTVQGVLAARAAACEYVAHLDQQFVAMVKAALPVE